MSVASYSSILRFLFASRLAVPLQPSRKWSSMSSSVWNLLFLGDVLIVNIGCSVVISCENINEYLLPRLAGWT
ncbi:hypothetical protein SPRG_08154 [Saprolegnia parasitica CBS 223.65]|uniref:Uncharacterized protein n=1 Tax=Saprolegnia parasitica (strain CBS 223.65) TaxID=695850 RepID=A0A067CCF4_SAPPC|nr:hypothetical protein SPRG_08154 [Saprolegnia parasitica CBS 223.65]KDO26865.1 hypothetical protein SPRG_08154 [Saprolegnia parasitica CBS 223.65]|eukprot:XP_012202508.1 hypothetical protein SPRG_08154 [Saprolegnia parasitica CBS 223.65]